MFDFPFRHRLDSDKMAEPNNPETETPVPSTQQATGGERKMERQATANTTTVAVVDYGLDQVLLELGSPGRFQTGIFSLLLVPVVLFSMYQMTYLFTTGRLDYRLVMRLVVINNQK